MMSLKICTDISNGFNNAFNYITLKGVRYIEEKKLSELKYQLADYEKENARLKSELDDLLTAIAPLSVKEWHKYAEENARLLEELKRERECVDFYAFKENWILCYEFGDDTITEHKYIEIEGDEELDECKHSHRNTWGGKKARETQAKRK